MYRQRREIVAVRCKIHTGCFRTMYSELWNWVCCSEPNSDIQHLHPDIIVDSVELQNWYVLSVTVGWNTW